MRITRILFIAVIATLIYGHAHAQPLPVNAAAVFPAPLAASTAAWTSATAQDTALSIVSTAFPSVAVTLRASSTMTAGNLTFEISDDGTNYYATTCVRKNTLIGETGFPLSVTTQAWICDAAGFQNFRVRLSTAITGTGTADLRIQAASIPMPTPIKAVTVSGTVTADAGTGTFTVDGSAVTQPISAASLPLPAGAATSANQDGIVRDGTGDTDQANVTTGRLHVDGSGVTQPVSGTVTANAGTGTFNIQANASTNTAQIGGNTVATGNGIAGTGTQRVTIASDNTAFSVNSTASQATAANLNAQTVGNVASAATDSGNPVKVGGIFNTTQPTVTDGQRVNAQSTSRGAMIVAPGVEGFTVSGASNLPVIVCNQNAFLNMTTATTTQIVALASGQIIYVCSYSLVTQGGVATNVTFVQGTGSNCATGQTARTSAHNITAAGNTVGIARGSGLGTILRTSSGGQALCVTSSGAATLGVNISYAQF